MSGSHQMTDQVGRLHSLCRLTEGAVLLPTGAQLQMFAGQMPLRCSLAPRLETLATIGLSQSRLGFELSFLFQNPPTPLGFPTPT